MTLVDKQIAILTAGDGVERVELTEPRRALEAAEAHVIHITPEGGTVRTFDQTDSSHELTADRPLAECDPAAFDGLVLPGGYINPDKLRRDANAMAFTRAFFEAGKPVGVICHGPWTLIEADVLRGRTLTAVESLKTDIRNAGGEWVDEDVHVDRSAENLLVSGRNYKAVVEFAQTVAREFAADLAASA
jgi:protease I